MSLIGPRPDPPDWLDKYPEDIKIFLSVKPGLTGYSQAYFRNSADGAEKMKNDAYYARHISFIMDIKIFFKTIAITVNDRSTELELLYIDDLVEGMFDLLENKEQHCEFDGVETVLKEDGRYSGYSEFCY